MKCSKCQTEIVGMSRFCPKCGAPVQMQPGQLADAQALDRIRQYEPFFGAWRIVQQVGKGGFSRVYEIERDEFGKKYKAAMKVISIPQDESEIQELYADGMDKSSISTYYQGCIKDITEEFDLMAHMKGNSNIVSYEDHLIIPHRDNIGADIFIRMELLSPLTKYLETHPITKKDVALIAIDICKALEICQKYNIVHRDLKPENIFVSELGNYKLGDFGIARTVEKSQTVMTKKGTLNYMSPEIYRGEQSDSTVDIYSLGLVMYRLCNRNRLPFLPPAPQPLSHQDKDNAMLRRMQGDPMDPPVDADDKLTAIIFKASAYLAADRYATPTQMRKELEDYVDSLAEETSPEMDEEDVTTQLDLGVTTATAVEPVSINYTAPSANFTAPSANFTSPSQNSFGGQTSPSQNSFGTQPSPIGFGANSFGGPQAPVAGNAPYTPIPVAGVDKPAKKKVNKGLIALLVVAILAVGGTLAFILPKLAADPGQGVVEEKKEITHKTAKKKEKDPEPTTAQDPDTDPDTNADPNTNTDDKDSPIATNIFTNADEFYLGSYYSKYFNVMAVFLLADWTIESRADLLELSDIECSETDDDAIREVMLEELQNDANVYDFFATTKDEKQAVAITMMYTSTDLMDEEACADSVCRTLEGKYDDVTVDYDTYYIAGANHIKVTSSYTDEGVLTYVDYVIIKKDKYWMFIYGASEEEDHTDEIINNFF